MQSGRHREAGAGFEEQAGVGLGRAEFACAQLERKKVGDADRSQIGVAIGQGANRQPRRDPAQPWQRIGKEIDAVAFAEEDRIGGAGQLRIVAAFVQRAFDGQPSQQAQVVRQLGELGAHALAQGAHFLDRKALGGARAVGLKPGVQRGFDAHADRRKRPQRVVEIEGNGANGHGVGVVTKGDVARRGAFNRFVWHAAGPVALGRDTVLALRGGDSLAADLDWLYSHDAESI